MSPATGRFPAPAEVADLSREEAEEVVEDLREEVRRRDHLYYVENEPEISDAEYDRLFEALERIEERIPDPRTDDSPTCRVGAEPRDEFPAVEHTAPMLSLEATGEREDLERFVERVREAEAAGTDLLEGLTFVFTGALERRTRSEVEELVAAHGGRATSSVSSETDYAVVGEDPGRTAGEAEEEGVTILDESDFVALLEEKGVEA